VEVRTPWGSDRADQDAIVAAANEAGGEEGLARRYDDPGEAGGRFTVFVGNDEWLAC
jgi:hypothetical protein